MKNFFEDTLEVIIKMLVTQLGMTMFGVMITMAAVSFERTSESANNVLSLVASVFSVFMYMFLLYIHVWNKGARDRIKIDGGRMKENKLKGLYMSLVANSLNLFLGLVMVATYYFCDFTTNPNSMVCQIFGTANDIARIIQGMFIGIVNYISPNAESTTPFLFLLITVPALFISSLGYYLGTKNKKVARWISDRPSK
jgi:hypothetical protein